MPKSAQPTPLEFPRNSTPGFLPGESDGRLINCILEKSGDKYLMRRAAGLASVATSGQSGPRGMVEMEGGWLVGAYAGQVVRWSGGTATTLTGGLTGTDPVTFARNLKQPSPDLVVVRSSGGAYVITGLATVAAYPDADLPATVNSVASLSAFLVYSEPTEGKLWASQVNSTDQSALSYASAEASPDGLIRVIRSGNAILACGENTIEPWLNAGKTPFPLIRHTTVIDVGLLEFGAIAGSQTGWDHGIIFVARDGTVRDLGGDYVPKVISTPDVERFIAASTPGTFDAQVFTDRGRAVWSLSSNLGTWHYCVDQKSWAERQSGGARWRATSTAKLGPTWYAQDLSSGSLLSLSVATRQDVGSTLPFQVQSVPFKGFPLRGSIPAVHLDLTRGNGGSVDFSFSLDGGRNWSAWENFSLGSTGEDDGPVIINRLGRASTHGLIIRVRVQDNVDFSFMGAAIPAGVELT